MGGEGQIHSALKTVCVVTFPQSSGVARVLLDADYLCAIGMDLVAQIVIALAKKPLRVCHLVDERLVWISDDSELRALFHNADVRCQTVHAVEAPLDVVLGQVAVHSHASPDYSPEILHLTREIPSEDKAHERHQEFTAEISGGAVVEEKLPQIDANPPKSSTLMASIRLFFEPAPAKAENTPKRESWWGSASTQLFRRNDPSPPRQLDFVPTEIADTSYRHSEPLPTSTHQLVFPRMHISQSQPHEDSDLRATPAAAMSSSQHTFHISSSWHYQAERMSASVRLPPRKEEKKGRHHGLICVDITYNSKAIRYILWSKAC